MSVSSDVLALLTFSHLTRGFMVIPCKRERHSQSNGSVQVWPTVCTQYVGH